MPENTVDRSVPLHDVRGGFLAMLGAEVGEVGPTKAVLTLEVGPEHAQPHGVLHGGVHATLVESAASVGGHQWMAERGGTVVGVTNTTHFFRPFTAGRLVATATPLHQGRSQQLWQVEITDTAGKIIARGEVRLHNMML
ncbi:MAG: PaaI family thioesterase [Sporichthyaceae bacterium]